MFRDFVTNLSTRRFWLSKWVVASIILAALLLIGIVALVTSGIDFDTFLNYFALGLLIFVFVTLFYGIIAIHDVPYDIAKHRDHPHQDAIHAAGWVSLFTLHAIWPFLWIWAMLYRPDRGWGMHVPPKAYGETRLDGVEMLNKRVANIERRLDERIR